MKIVMTRLLSIFLFCLASLAGNAAAQDFDGDGKRDIFFVGRDGQISIYLIQPGSFKDYGFLTIDPGWQFVGYGDFDGDGKTDLLWRDPNGVLRVWYMNGVRLREAVTLPSSYPLNQTTYVDGTTVTNQWQWQVAAFGDFNGDGKTDILWYAPITSVYNDSIGDYVAVGGCYYIWLVGTTGTGSVSPASPSQQICSPYGAAHPIRLIDVIDWDGDGKTDLLFSFRDWTTNRNFAWIWNVNGTVNSYGVQVGLGVDGKVQAVGDFDGDGKQDFLWSSGTPTSSFPSACGRSSNLVPTYIRFAKDPPNINHDIDSRSYGVTPQSQVVEFVGRFRNGATNNDILWADCGWEIWDQGSSTFSKFKFPISSVDVIGPIGANAYPSIWTTSSYTTVDFDNSAVLTSPFTADWTANYPIPNFIDAYSDVPPTKFGLSTFKPANVAARYLSNAAATWDYLAMANGMVPERPLRVVEIAASCSNGGVAGPCQDNSNITISVTVQRAGGFLDAAPGDDPIATGYGVNVGISLAGLAGSSPSDNCGWVAPGSGTPSVTCIKTFPLGALPGNSFTITVQASGGNHYLTGFARRVVLKGETPTSAGPRLQHFSADCDSECFATQDPQSGSVGGTVRLLADAMAPALGGRIAKMAFVVGQGAPLTGPNGPLETCASDCTVIAEKVFTSPELTPRAFLDYLWMHVPVGAYSIRIRATDQTGRVVWSSPIAFNISAPNTLPSLDLFTVNCVAPCVHPASATLAVNASDSGPNAGIAKVGFIQGQGKPNKGAGANLEICANNNTDCVLLGENVMSGQPPIVSTNYLVQNLTAPFVPTEYAFRARVTDKSGGVTWSPVQKITVNPPGAPVLTMSFQPSSVPLNGTTTLIYSLKNNNTTTISNISFSNWFSKTVYDSNNNPATVPSGLSLNSTAVTSSGCGNVMNVFGSGINTDPITKLPMKSALAVGQTAVHIENVIISPNAICTISIQLLAGVEGLINNSVDFISSPGTAQGGRSTAVLLVTTPPKIDAWFELPDQSRDLSPMVYLNVEKMISVSAKNLGTVNVFGVVDALTPLTASDGSIGLQLGDTSRITSSPVGCGDVRLPDMTLPYPAATTVVFHFADLRPGETCTVRAPVKTTNINTVSRTLTIGAPVASEFAGGTVTGEATPIPFSVYSNKLVIDLSISGDVSLGRVTLKGTNTYGSVLTNGVSISQSDEQSNTALLVNTDYCTFTSPNGIENAAFSCTYTGLAAGRIYSFVANSNGTPVSNIVRFSMISNDVIEGQMCPAPSTGTAVGATAGSFDVAESGAATYSIPIALPPGTAGMQPSIGLSYNSQGGGGLVGMGWSMSATSAVHRCPATTYSDGYKGQVSFNNATDKFCLDGQRLMQVADGTYRTERDSFSRITFMGTGTTDPGCWKVESKSGLIMLYGTTSTSSCTGGSNSLFNSRITNTPKAWSLAKALDRNGNYYLVDYEKDADTGVNANGNDLAQRPLRIRYTGNDAAGIAPYAAVEFGYEANTVFESNVTYDSSGSKSKQSKRLSLVTTRVDSQIARTYTLSYGTTAGPAGTNRSLLQSITECGVSASGSLCLPPTTVAWQTPVASDYSFVVKDTFSYSVPDTNQVYSLDINGDGKTDYIRYKGLNSSTQLYEWDVLLAGRGTAQNWTTPVSNNRIVWGDFNGDGKTDFVSEAGTNWTMCLSTGTAFNCTPVALPHEIPSSASQAVAMSGDFNGDGRIDIAYYEGRANLVSQWKICLSTGTDFACTGVLNGPYERDDTPGPPNMAVGDFNGDGKADIAGYGKGNQYTDQWQVAFSNFELTQVSGVWTVTGGLDIKPMASATSDVAYKTVVADFNGDGMADLVANNGGSYRVCLSKSDGTFDCADWGNRYADVSEFLLGDFNGDGRTDVAQYKGALNGGSGWNVCLSTGSNFVCNNWLAQDGVLVGGDMSSRNPAGDWDGTGKTSIQVLMNGNATFNRIGMPDMRPDLVTSITDGLGKQAQFSYAPLTDSTVYTKGVITSSGTLASAVFPELDIQSPMYVVQSMSTNNGIGGMRSFTYTYSGLRGHSQGAGLAGFNTRTVTDQTTGRATTTTYAQDFANRITGAPLNSETRTSTGVLLSKSTSYYQMRSVAASGNTRIYQVYPTQSTQEAYDPNLPSTTAYLTTTSNTALSDIDDYGNVQVTTTSTSDGVVKTTSSNFVTKLDVTNWLVGRPARVSVKTDFAGQSLTRVSQFDYYPGTTLVKQEIIEPDRTDETRLTTDYQYDAVGNRTSTTVTGVGLDANGRVTTAEYNDSRKRFADKVKKVVRGSNTTNPLTLTSTATYDPLLGVVTSSTDPNGLTALAQYDALGRKYCSYQPEGVTQSTSYGGGGGVTNAVMSVISNSSAGGTSTSYVDILGREVLRSASGFSGTVLVKANYDARGRKTQVSRPYFSSGSPTDWTTFTYDDVTDRLITETAPDSGVTTYDYAGFTSWVKRSPTNGTADLQIVKRVVNSQGWTMSVTDAANNTTSYAYDPLGNLTTVTKPTANATVQMFYDIRGRKTQLIDPDAGTITYTYDALGGLLTESVSGGRNTGNTYDNLGRLTSKSETVTSLGVTKNFTTTNTYDCTDSPASLGKLCSESYTTPLGTNSRAWVRDNTSRITSTKVATNGKTFTSFVLYDNHSRVKQSSFPVTGLALAYTYDANGYTTTVSEIVPGGSPKVHWSLASRFADGQLNAMTIGGVLSVAKTYDALGRVSAIQAGSVQNAGFTYDKLGNLLTRSDSYAGYSDTFTYDNLNRLTSANLTAIGNETYSYDTLGNLTKPGVAAAYVAGTNRLNTVNGGTLNYDAGGNITGDGTRTFSYTPFDIPDRITQGNQFMEYGFTADHQRVFERTGTGSNVAGITYYVSPGVFEEDDALTAQQVVAQEYRHYISTPEGTIGYIAVHPDGTAKTRYFLKDHLGSNVAVVTETGTVESRSRYTPWGARTTTGVLDTSERGFTGHEHLAFGLIHMNGRIYDPAWGRFLQADPLIQSPYDLQNYNRYAYVMNNPLAFTDPSGFSRWIKFRDRYLKPIVAIVASYYAGQFASSWFLDSSGYGAMVSATVDTADVSYATAMSMTPTTYGISVGTANGLVSGAASGFAAGGIMGGNLNSALQGAVTGGIGGAAIGYFGNTYNRTRVLTDSVVGGVNARIQGRSFSEGFKRSAVISLLTYGNWSVRQEMIRQSQINELNANGTSGGLFDDRFSLAGARREYDPDGNPLPCRAPLGGCQGAPIHANDQGKNFFGIPYTPKSIFDAVNESFSGPHDWFRNLTGSYDIDGNSKYFTGLRLQFDKFMNFANLLPAAPFAAAAYLESQLPGQSFMRGR
jgi:RHS repeat-associated protein